MTDTNDKSQGSQMVSPASKDALIRPLIIAVALIGVGIWCYSDRSSYPAPEAWNVKHINDAAGYVLNHIIGPYLLIPLGVIFGIYALMMSRRKVVADEHGIGYAGKDKLSWSDIKNVDASRLQDKQILYLEHVAGKMKLDGYKLDNFKPLVEMIEAKVNPQTPTPEPENKPEGESGE